MNALFDKLPRQPAPDSNVAKARRAWGDHIPDWVLIFAEQCDQDNMRNVASRIGYSHSVASQVLSKTYLGRIDKIEAAVSGAFMGAIVNCPVLGELATDQCLYHQGRKFAPTNPTRVQLHRACPKCPNFKKPQAAQPEE